MGQADWLKGYDPEALTIATAVSHSSLQILHGARQEGFRTLAIAAGDRDLRYYDAFPLARPDRILRLDRYQDLLGMAAELRKDNVILVPHGSLVEYLGPDNYINVELPIYGNRKVLHWESDRDKQREWLEAGGITMPRKIPDPKEISEPVIVKYHGAKGGRGFFICNNYHEFRRHIKEGEPYTIQEFVLGTRYYLHFFFSPITTGGFQVHVSTSPHPPEHPGAPGGTPTGTNGPAAPGRSQPAGKAGDGAGSQDHGLGQLQMLSIDRRDESNIDEANRLGSIKDLEAIGVQPTFVVTGNIPIVIRESLLPEVFRMGEGVVREAYKRFGGLWGPFCLETVVTPELKFKVFEISARIVAGTNPFIAGSPYSEMVAPGLSTGRRIAQEIRRAAKGGRLAEIVS